MRKIKTTILWGVFLSTLLCGIFILLLIGSWWQRTRVLLIADQYWLAAYGEESLFYSRLWEISRSTGTPIRTIVVDAENEPPDLLSIVEDAHQHTVFLSPLYAYLTDQIAEETSSKIVGLGLMKSDDDPGSIAVPVNRLQATERAGKAAAMLTKHAPRDEKTGEAALCGAFFYTGQLYRRNERDVFIKGFTSILPPEYLAIEESTSLFNRSSVRGAMESFNNNGCRVICGFGSELNVYLLHEINRYTDEEPLILLEDWPQQFGGEGPVHITVGIDYLEGLMSFLKSPQKEHEIHAELKGVGNFFWESALFYSLRLEAFLKIN